ncbi:helix-turn-helix transcriptional regulator [Kitasatospora nipponensis]|uniref:Helix-turn-helix transcriptional regulator n=1 Tax=Kitasatospora nipponensis TaxID=258049 RepID=A0ABP4HHS6_9ACTN
MSINPQTARSLRAFGRQLQQLREATRPRVTQKAVGEAIGKSRDIVSFIERGGQWPTARQLMVMLDLYEVDAQTRAAFQALYFTAQEAADVWWAEYPDLSKNLVRLIELEDVAEKVWIYASGSVPGLLQTPDYIKAIFHFEALEFGNSRTSLYAEVRHRRSEVLRRRRPIVLDAVIAEGTLREHAGGAEVMRGQLKYLLEMSTRPNITIRVIPKEAAVAPSSVGPFSIFDFASEPSIRIADVLSGISFTEEAKPVRYARRLYDYMGGFAATPLESTALIEKLIKEI